MASPTSSDPTPAAGLLADPGAKPTLGLRLARWSGWFLAAYLLLGAVPLAVAAVLVAGGEAWALGIKGLFFALYAALLLLPWGAPERLGRWWLRLLAALIGCTVAFVFVLIFETMFRYIDMAALGKKLPVPGFQGLQIFIALLQVPTAVFLKYPQALK